MTIQEIENCGIIGAGGAGFPSHVKLNSKPDTVIMNAAECEPLLHKDMELILNYTDEVLLGLKKVMEITGAENGIIGIKDKHHHEIELLNSKVSGNIKVVPIEDIYPAGDELVLIHMTTKRVVQPGALPISVGCVVQNVETLLNIGLAKPVVDKYVSIAGAVEKPATVKVPVGTTFADILSHFKTTAKQYSVRVGGLMMGELESDLSSVVTKKTGALIILPSDHHCVTVYNRFALEDYTEKLAKAACDQCSFCTELCPRYLLGQPVRPEMAMRNRMFSSEEQPMVFPGNNSCCECNLCTMYACPEGLNPKGVMVMEKRLSRELNLKWEGRESVPHPMNDYRKVPTKKLMQRLDVLMFKDEGPLTEINLLPKEVKILLNQHIGAPSESIVHEGQAVKRYELIAKANGQISSNVHSSIDGIVREISETEIIIQAN
ncbi:MAG: 4Fe-4S dicluster domain-containing protein [Bacteroidota bacterium]